jgi:hypothetical protein
MFASEENDHRQYSFVADASRSLEIAISRILFRKPAALCIPVATVGNEITWRPAISCAWDHLAWLRPDELCGGITNAEVRAQVEKS